MADHMEPTGSLSRVLLILHAMDSMPADVLPRLKLLAQPIGKGS
jgi:hypothetical protein